MTEDSQKKFEILEHTADLRIKVFGSSPKELFTNALYAMASVQKSEAVEKGTVRRLIGQIRGRKVSVDIFVESMDYDTLLVDFLSEVLSHSDTEQAVFYEANFKKFSDNGLDAIVTGFKVDDFEKDIKAVTYHEVNVKEIEPGKWESLLVFDI